MAVEDVLEGFFQSATPESYAPPHLKGLRKQLHDFRESQSQGNRGEYEIDLFLRRNGNEVQSAPIELQALGVDRICIGDVGGLPYYTSLEYKTDVRASETGNLFIETQIREREGHVTAGWLRKSVAQTLVFFLPQTRRLFFVDTADLREWIFLYGRTLKHSHWVENKGGYAGRGLLLPIVQGQESLRTWIEVQM